VRDGISSNAESGNPFTRLDGARGCGEAACRSAGPYRRGDRNALKLVYRDTAAKLFGVCLRILDDRGEAEDVL
jgi:RNA polymerase sigma-70 factor (ECF subfamily)